MAINQGLFSSAKDCWETPQSLFDVLDAEFHFDLDVCALPANAKCPRFYTPNDNGLIQPWDGTCNWCNPPYGRHIAKWIEKAYLTAIAGGKTVMLLPARTDTKWFHNYIYGQAEIRFIKGRLKFGDSKNSAPFPSMIVVFRPKEANHEVN